jgi:hypothetical protein
MSHKSVMAPNAIEARVISTAESTLRATPAITRGYHSPFL